MARHISRLEIDTFRGIRGLNLDDFGDVNIITGDNNSGKTSLLEVLASFDAPAYMRTWLRLERSSGRRNSLSAFETFDMLFDVDREKKEISYRIMLDGSDHSVFVNADLHQTSLRQSQIDKIIGLGRRVWI